MNLPTCSAKECDNSIRCKNLCSTHYSRFIRNGSTELIGMKGRSAEERFQFFLGPVTDTGCREWQGHRDKDGYGTLVVNSKRVKAHRYAWIRVNGEIPPGLVIDHFKCDNPPCVEITHIKPTTVADNTLRSNKTITGINSRKTICPKGHSYQEFGKINCQGGRECSICRKEIWKRANAKRKR